MRAISLISLLAVLAGCPAEPPPAPIPGSFDTTGEVVVTVNDTVVTQDMIDAVTSRLPDGALEQMKERGEYDRLIDNLVMGQLLYNEAIASGLHDDPEVQKALAMATREVLAGEFLSRKADEAVTDEKLQEMYERRKVQYARPQVHARHILVKEEDLANELMAKLEGGADFAQLAGEFSTDPGSGAKGGDLGWFEKRRMVKPFADAAFEAEKGAVVGPVESRFGFHIIEVLDKRDSTPLEEVRDELEKAVQDEVIKTYLDDLKTNAKIERADAKPEGATDVLDEVTPPPAPEGVPAPPPEPQPE